MSRLDTERDELRAKFTKYIELVIIHAKLDFIRKSRKAPQELSLDDLDYEPAISFEQQYAMASVEKHKFDFEEEKLAKAFEQLPLMRQRVLEMLFVEELPAVEIAQKMNCSVKYVYGQKYLAMQKLRMILGGDSDDGT